MLYEIMRYLKNFFLGNRVEGTFIISDGKVSLPFVSRYALIEGSIFNNGLHECPLLALEDETFSGSITAVNPPNEFLKLVEEIEEYVQKNSESPYVSESFGGYSYTKATDSNGNVVGWQDAYKDRLKVWRKI